MSAPAPITFFCIHCGAKLQVPVELAGETGPCPRCFELIAAPLVSSVAATAAVAPEPVSRPQPVVGGRGRVLAPPVRDEFLLDSGRPPGGMGGWSRTNGPSAAVRSAATRGTLPPEPVPEGRSGSPRRPVAEERRGGGFSVVLAILLVAIGCGGAYLGWRMGLWEPAEEVGGDSSGAPLQVAKTGPSPGAGPDARLIATGGSGVGEATGEERPAVPRSPVLRPVPPAVLATLPTSVSPASEPAPTPAPSPAASLAVASPAVASPAVASPAAPEPAPAVPPVAVKGSPAAMPAPASPGPHPEIKETVTVLHPPLERARNVIRRFLEAESWKDRVGVVSAEGAPAEVLSAYYQSRPDLPVRDYRLDFFHTEKLPDGASAHVFFLTYANEVDGFPVIVKGQGEDYLLDWDLYVEFRDRWFQRFAEEPPADPARFRVVLQRVTYLEDDRDQIPLVDQLLCYKIDPPYPGFTRHVFVEKGSEAGKDLSACLTWESDPLAGEVELRWAEFPNGKRYLTVERLVARSWVR